MTDLVDLLDSAAGHAATPTPDLVADDVRRGRRALLHRRWARGSAVALAGVAAVAAAVVAPGLVDGASPQRVQVAVPATGGDVSPAPAGASVPLVPDPAPDKASLFAAALVPQGWQRASTDYALLFAPAGVTTSADDFAGKLLVMLAPDQTSAPGARPVTVGGASGTLSHEGGTAILVFTLADGRRVVVQAPEALGWDAATLLRFAEGLAISPRAKAAVG